MKMIHIPTLKHYYLPIGTGQYKYLKEKLNSENLYLVTYKIGDETVFDLGIMENPVVMPSKYNIRKTTASEFMWIEDDEEI